MAHAHHLSSDQIALLALVFTVLVGAGLIPVLIVARLAVVIGRYIAYYAALEAFATARSEPLKWLVVTLAAVFGLGFATPASAAAVEKPAAVAASTETAPSASRDLDNAITRTFVLVTGKAAKPMPVWLLNSAVRIYTAYRTYRNGQKVEEASCIAHAALAEIAHVRAEIEAGRQVSQHEQRVTHARLEAQAEQLEGLAQRVTAVEQRTQRLEQTTGRVVRIATRRGCRTFQAFDRKLRRCTDRR